MTVTMDALHPAEHFKLKEHYGRYLKIAGLLAVFFHVLGAIVSPPYVPSPYQLTEEKLQLIEIPDDIVIPPPPKAIERPPIPMDMEISELADPITTIGPTDFSFKDFIPPPVPALDDWESGGVSEAPPGVVHQVVPEYPELAKMAEAVGTVHVMVLIDETGRVISAEVVQSTANEMLEQAALAAAYQWLFKPGMQGDMKVKTRTVIPFSFSLD